MSFLGGNKKHTLNCNYRQLYKKTSLMYPIPISTNNHLKRTSSFLLFSQKGSMTIEASVAIPLFLFAILNLFSLILFMGEYSAETARMQQEAKLLSVHAHVLGEGQSEWICLEKPMKIEPLISLVGFPTAASFTGAHARKWIGYDLNKSGFESIEDEWVYITPSGETFHRQRNCSYINPSLRCASIEEMKSKRNADGSKYYSCVVCGGSNNSGLCFYTEYGSRYHLSLQCSSLKRNVKTVLLSQVGNRRPCSKCGGKIN